MKSLLAITTVVLISASALMAGENKCPEAAKAEKSCETACAASAKECSKAKECPKAAAALRKTLLTHKGALLVQR